MSINRGSTVPRRYPELARGGCHLSLSVPRSKTTTMVPVVTQNVLPLSRSERLRIPAVGSDAAQETEEPDGAVEVDGAV
ncbi:MAG: hypothetical protein M3Z75_27485, partial [Actinomycetota bacterium]|nr:hypothetical protein [Actinomycetota bacterium]